jgi:hypothetical protein
MMRTERRAPAARLLVIQGVVLAAFGAIIIAMPRPANALDNGLALTPVCPAPARYRADLNNASASASEATPNRGAWWCFDYC